MNLDSKIWGKKTKPISMNLFDTPKYVYTHTWKLKQRGGGGANILKEKKRRVMLMMIL
jgi:hypothetical protein